MINVISPQFCCGVFHLSDVWYVNDQDLTLSPVRSTLERKPEQEIKFVIDRQQDPGGAHLKLFLNGRQEANGHLIRDCIINAIDSVIRCLCYQNCCEIGCV